MLAAELEELLASIAVAPDCRSAKVAQRTVEASSQAELAFRLGRAIYEVHHVGWAQAPADSEMTGQDEHLEALLRAAIPHRWVTRPARLLSAGLESDIVQIEGVKVAFPHRDVKAIASPPTRTGPKPAPQPPADTEAKTAPQPPPGVTVRLPSARPALSPGYFVADGSRALEVTGDLLRVYVHLRSEEALVHTWQAVLDALEECGAGYRSKVTSVPALLPRRDALVIYLDGAATATAALIAELACDIADGQEVSAFTERLGPGVGIGWEPSDRRPPMRGLSFGEHRSRAVAEGLLAHAASGQQVSAAASVYRALVSAGIDPASPARNLPASA